MQTLTLRAIKKIVTAVLLFCSSDIYAAVCVISSEQMPLNKHTGMELAKYVKQMAAKDLIIVTDKENIPPDEKVVFVI